MATINGTNYNDNGTFQGTYPYLIFYPILTGTSVADTIYGYGGNDILDGGAGVDTMYGGTGNDSYYVDNIDDIAAENFNEGTDTVYASVSYSLRSNVENLNLTGTSIINGYGNSLNNVINGNSANNIIYGYGGNDTINGGAGVDTMYGGAGNDSYYVYNTGDLVVENFNEGTDIVYASITYTLTSNVENLNLTGTGVINGYGNSLNNVINGNNANNIIYGYAGNDTINGGAGVDTMYGGAGNDSYYVYNTGDLVVENFNEGTDTVYASITYTLTSNVENLNLTGTSVINGYGNSLNNVINGNSANNIIYGYGGNDTINGGAGADIMYGGAGNDTYYFDNINDIVAENFNEGIDTVYASADYLLRSYSSSLDLIMRSDPENIILTGTANLVAEGSSVNNTIIGNSGGNRLYGYGGHDTIYGRDGDDSIYAGPGGGEIYGENGNDQLLGGDDIDTLFGGAGDDLLLGNGGNDVLYGGAGADYFYFIYLSEGIDIIVDFESSANDKILIDQVGFGASSVSQFTYDSSTGNLFFQSTQFATIANNPLGFNISSDLVLL